MSAVHRDFKQIFWIVAQWEGRIYLRETKG